MTPPPAALFAAQAAIVLLLPFELCLLARFLAWRADEARPHAARQAWLGLAALAAVFALAAGMVARSGALAPGVSGAGMPWERVTDDSPLLAAANAGQRAYLNRCAPCHLPEGVGLPPAYPALIGSRYLEATKTAHARAALFGSAELRQVAGYAHDPARGQMPAFAGAVSDAELAAILTYERVAFSANLRGETTGGVDPDSARHHVRPGDVARARALGPPR